MADVFYKQVDRKDISRKTINILEAYIILLIIFLSLMRDRCDFFKLICLFIQWLCSECPNPEYNTPAFIILVSGQENYA